jgi:hopanoid biosynthesis associated protein HpnK
LRYLIVNADDFGWSERVNAAVLRAHREGILTSASLMVAESGWQEAVQIARDNPVLGVGLHVALTFDRPLLPVARIPHLVRSTGKFETDPLRAGLRYAFSRAARRELGEEMEAQFERFASTGLPWDHVDGHQHFHMHPVVFRRLLALCDTYGVNRLRVPRESLTAHLRGAGDGLTPLAAGAMVLQILCRINLRALRRKGTLGGRPIFLCDRVYGDFQSGNMHTAYTLRLLDRLEGRTCEIYYHPGAEYARPLPPAEQADGVRDVELKALLDRAVKAKAAALGLRLATYAEAEACGGLTPPTR